jgi:hypothetical protein
LRWIRVGLVLALVTATVVSAQGFGFGGRFGACRSNWDADGYFVSPFFSANPKYDGRVTFARIKYRGGYECGREGPGWAHDYPRTESHFARILGEISTAKAFVGNEAIAGGAVVRLDEPALSYYPIAYLSEPGGWNMSDAEVTGLRNYIQRGGFIVVDDIEGAPNPDYENLIAQWRRAFPEARPIRLTNEHRIFHSFFTIDLSKIPSKTGVHEPEYMAIFEDNDPAKRMVAIIDNYADVGELIQFSDEGFDIVPANEAYKLWINYFVYALTR